MENQCNIYLTTKLPVVCDTIFISQYSRMPHAPASFALPPACLSIEQVALTSSILSYIR